MKYLKLAYPIIGGLIVLGFTFYFLSDDAKNRANYFVSNFWCPDTVILEKSFNYNRTAKLVNNINFELILDENQSSRYYGTIINGKMLVKVHNYYNLKVNEIRLTKDTHFIRLSINENANSSFNNCKIKMRDEFIDLFEEIPIPNRKIIPEFAIDGYVHENDQQQTAIGNASIEIEGTKYSESDANGKFNFRLKSATNDFVKLSIVKKGYKPHHSILAYSNLKNLDITLFKLVAHD